MTRVSAAEAIAPLGDSLFGDSTNYYSGATTFSVTDIDLPGNSALPVRLTRTHSATEARGPTAPGLLGEWELEVPYVHGTFATDLGWRVSGPNPNARCSTPFNSITPPDAVVSGTVGGRIFPGADYWAGNSLSVPGQGSQMLLARSPANTLVPTDGQNYPWATLSHWQVRCLPSLASGEAGEGFLALAPDGSKYTFNWMAKRRTSRLSGTKSNGSVPVSFVLERDEIRLYATRVEDRFGNWVTYDYIGGQLQKIEANDGRIITFEYYASNGKLHFARAHGRTWEYNYTSSNRLSEVILPDASKWQYNTSVFIYVYLPPQPGHECEAGEPHPSVTRRSYTLTHPSGATGYFEFDPIRHKRFRALPNCSMDGKGEPVPGVAKTFDTYALARKTISGPGVPGLVWTLAFNPQSITNSTKIATLTMPNGEQTRFTFGTEFYKNEGKLLKEEVLSANGTQLRLTENEYAIDPVSPPYAYHLGNGMPTDVADEFASAFQVPLIDTKITQQGEVFRTHVYGFTNTLSPTEVGKSRVNGIGRNRTPQHTDNYWQNFTAQWVLNQLERRVEGDPDFLRVTAELVLARDPTTLLPTSHQNLGQLPYSYEYDAYGILKKIIDPSLKAVTLDSWRRGTPQLVT